jgi:hypothetical protein
MKVPGVFAIQTSASFRDRKKWMQWQKFWTMPCWKRELSGVRKEMQTEPGSGDSTRFGEMRQFGPPPQREC